MTGCSGWLVDGVVVVGVLVVLVVLDGLQDVVELEVECVSDRVWRDAGSGGVAHGGIQSAVGPVRRGSGLGETAVPCRGRIRSDGAVCCDHEAHCSVSLFSESRTRLRRVDEEADFFAGRLAGVFFAGAFLAGAFLAGAFLAGAFLAGAFAGWRGMGGIGWFGSACPKIVTSTPTMGMLSACTSYSRFATADASWLSHSKESSHSPIGPDVGVVGAVTRLRAQGVGGAVGVVHDERDASLLAGSFGHGVHGGLLGVEATDRARGLRGGDPLGAGAASEVVGLHAELAGRRGGGGRRRRFVRRLAAAAADPGRLARLSWPRRSGRRAAWPVRARSISVGRRFVPGRFPAATWYSREESRSHSADRSRIDTPRCRSAMISCCAVGPCSAHAWTSAGGPYASARPRRLLRASVVAGTGIGSPIQPFTRSRPVLPSSPPPWLDWQARLRHRGQIEGVTVHPDQLRRVHLECAPLLPLGPALPVGGGR